LKKTAVFLFVRRSQETILPPFSKS
jgi:hypothetical protein